MKKILLVAVAALGLAACDRVDSGYVGVQVDRYGSSAGVQEKPLGVGTYWFRFGSDIYPYPVFTNRYAWAKTEEKNEEITFQDKNGLIVSADVNVAYRVNPALAPKLFQTYRGSMDDIVAGPLRDRVRSAINNSASAITVEDIYGPKKSLLIANALKQVRAYFKPMGLEIDQLDWAGPIRIPDSIMDRIKSRAQSEQAKIAAEAQVATEEAEGRAKVAKAKAEAEAATAIAEGEAAVTRAKNAAIAQNPGYQDEWIRKWDGQLPQTVYCSSETPCVSVGGELRQ